MQMCVCSFVAELNVISGIFRVFCAKFILMGLEVENVNVVELFWIKNSFVREGGR